MRSAEDGPVSGELAAEGAGGRRALGPVIRATVQIQNRLGLHARAAARFVHVANAFKSRVSVTRDGRTMDGKSILGILLLAASQGAWIELSVEGEDADAAVTALLALVESGFGEEA